LTRRSSDVEERSERHSDLPDDDFAFVEGDGDSARCEAKKAKSAGEVRWRSEARKRKRRGETGRTLDDRPVRNCKR